MYWGQTMTINKAAEAKLSHTGQTGESETDGVNKRRGSELHWLVCVVNFLLSSAWRNSIDSLQSGARVICITSPPLSSLPVAQPLCLHCATEAMLDRSAAGLRWFPSPWLLFNCFGFVLAQAACDALSLTGLLVTMTFISLCLSFSNTQLHFWVFLLFFFYFFKLMTTKASKNNKYFMHKWQYVIFFFLIHPFA